MGILGWVAANWFSLASLLVGSGLWVTGVSLRAQTKAQRVANLFAAIHHHHEVWAELYREPVLARVLDPTVDLTARPPTLREEGFVNMVIQQTNGVYQALQNGLVIKPEGLRSDVAAFFSLPIPFMIWNNMRDLQNDDFAAFVDSCLRWKRSDAGRPAQVRRPA